MFIPKKIKNTIKTIFINSSTKKNFKEEENTVYKSTHNRRKTINSEIYRKQILVSQIYDLERKINTFKKVQNEKTLEILQNSRSQETTFIFLENSIQKVYSNIIINCDREHKTLKRDIINAVRRTSDDFDFNDELEIVYNKNFLKDIKEIISKYIERRKLFLSFLEAKYYQAFQTRGRNKLRLLLETSKKINLKFSRLEQQEELKELDKLYFNYVKEMSRTVADIDNWFSRLNKANSDKYSSEEIKSLIMRAENKVISDKIFNKFTIEWNKDDKKILSSLNKIYNKNIKNYKVKQKKQCSQILEEYRAFNNLISSKLKKIRSGEELQNLYISYKMEMKTLEKKNSVIIEELKQKIYFFRSLEIDTNSDDLETKLLENLGSIKKEQKKLEVTLDEKNNTFEEFKKIYQEGVTKNITLEAYLYEIKSYHLEKKIAFYNKHEKSIFSLEIIKKVPVELNILEIKKNIEKYESIKRENNENIETLITDIKKTKEEIINIFTKNLSATISSIKEESKKLNIEVSSKLKQVRSGLQLSNLYKMSNNNYSILENKNKTNDFSIKMKVKKLEDLNIEIVSLKVYEDYISEYKNSFDNCMKIKNELQIKFDKYNDFQKLNQNFKDKFKELREHLQKIEKKNFGERIYYFNSKKKYIKNSEKIPKAYYIKEIDNDFSEYEKEYKVYTKEYKFLYSKIEEAIEAMQKDYYLSLNAVKKVLKSCDITLEKYIRDIKNGEIIDENIEYQRILKIREDLNIKKIYLTQDLKLTLLVRDEKLTSKYFKELDSYAKDLEELRKIKLIVKTISNERKKIVNYKKELEEDEILLLKHATLKEKINDINYPIIEINLTNYKKIDYYFNDERKKLEDEKKRLLTDLKKRIIKDKKELRKKVVDEFNYTVKEGVNCISEVKLKYRKYKKYLDVYDWDDLENISRFISSYKKILEAIKNIESNEKTFFGLGKKIKLRKYQIKITKYKE